MERKKKRVHTVEIAYLPSEGSFRLIGFDSQNPLLPSWGRILSPPSLREQIFFSLSTTSSSLSGIIFLFPGLSLRGVRDLEAGKFVDNIVFADFPPLSAYLQTYFPYRI